jgi:hypothetical protein
MTENDGKFWRAHALVAPAPSPRPEGSTDPEPLGTCDSPSAAGRPHRETRHCVNWEPVRAPAPEPVRGFTLSPEDLKSAGEMLGNIAPGFAGKAPPPAPTRDGTALTEEDLGWIERNGCTDEQFFALIAEVRRLRARQDEAPGTREVTLAPCPACKGRIQTPPCSPCEGTGAVLAPSVTPEARVDAVFRSTAIRLAEAAVGLAIECEGREIPFDLHGLIRGVRDHANMLRAAARTPSPPRAETGREERDLVVCGTWRHGAVENLPHVRTKACERPRPAASPTTESTERNDR